MKKYEQELVNRIYTPPKNLYGKDMWHKDIELTTKGLGELWFHLSDNIISELDTANCKTVLDFFHLKKKDMGKMSLETTGTIYMLVRVLYKERDKMDLPDYSSRELLMEKSIMSVYNRFPFSGFTEAEIKTDLPSELVPNEKEVKEGCERLIVKNRLLKIDGKYYRANLPFRYALDICWLDSVSERDRACVHLRMKRYTLDQIAAALGVNTRETARLIIKRTVRRVSAWYKYHNQGIFADEKYEYFYKTYHCSRYDAIPEDAFAYFQLLMEKRGNRPLKEAVEDLNVDPEIKLKILQGVSQGKIYLDGKWYKARKPEMEEYVLEKYGKDPISYEQFMEQFNRCMEKHDMTFRLSKQQRRGKLDKWGQRKDRNILCSPHGMIRYYDIGSRKFGRLLKALRLTSYKNTFISTAKWFEQYPDIMQEYDIRTKYELHNLLRKIVPEDGKSKIKFSRMPTVMFGDMTMQEMIEERLKQLMPISKKDFMKIIKEETGCDATILTCGRIKDLDRKYLKNGTYKENPA